MDDEALEREVERTIARFRTFGLVLLIFGSLMFLGFLGAALSPSTSIRINHVETFDFAAKMKTAAFVGIFPLIGAFLAFVPKRKVTPLMRAQFMRIREIHRALGFKR